MFSLVMSLCSRDVITIHSMEVRRLTDLICSKAPGFWMVEDQLVFLCKILKVWSLRQQILLRLRKISTNLTTH